MNFIEESKLINLGQSLEFKKICKIDTSQLQFDCKFRSYCEQNLCGQYNKNYSCPPLCGTYEEMKSKILSYNNALVFQSQFVIHNLKDETSIKQIQKWHNSTMLKVLNSLSNNDGFIIGSSHCTLCNNCNKKQNKNCKYSKLKFSCMSAYCINVKELADVCGMDYEYKNNVLSLFGMYVYNKK